jgi:uncharacterized membrane protein YkoI
MRGLATRSAAALLLGAALLLAAAARGQRAGDAERAREGVEAGRFVRVTSILEWLEHHYFGHVLEVELDPAEDDEPATYEIEWLTPQGHVIEFEFDAHTGKLLETEGRGLDEARRP